MSTAPVDGGRHRRFAWVAILLSLGLALLLAEVSLRALHAFAGGRSRSRTDHLWEFCESRHHRLRPNESGTHDAHEFHYRWANNSLGMRDRERPLEKPSGSFRILFLGDSFVQGHGVPLSESMPALLEKSLNAPPREKEIEVVNGGVFGYSPILESLYLEEIAERVAPDMVVMGLFLGNDIGEDAFYTEKASIAPDGSAVSFHDHEWPWTRIVTALNEQEGIVRPDDRGAHAAAAPRRGGLIRLKLALGKLETYRLATRAIKSLAGGDGGYRARREREFALVQAHRGEIQYDLGLVNYPVLTREQRQVYWKLTERYLAAIDGTCRRLGIPLILVVIPPIERLNGTTDFDEPYEIAGGIGKEMSVPVIQLLDTLRAADPYAVYYRFDRHWTAAGHRLAARALDREIRRLSLLPREAPR